MKGLHLIADLYRCRCEAEWLDDAEKLQEWCVATAQAVGLEPIAQGFHALEAGGVSGTVLMPGAHICLHTWPGEQAAAADVYVGDAGSDRSAKARGLMYALVQRFQPEWTEQRSLDRGEED